MSELRDLLRELPSTDVPPPDVKEALFSRAKRGAEGRIVRARRVRIAGGTAGALLLIVGAVMGLRAWGSAPEVAHQPTERVPSSVPSVAPSILVEASARASVAGRPIESASLEGEVLALEVDDGGELTLHREEDRLHMEGEGALTLHTGTPLRVELLRGSVELEGTFSFEGPSCSGELEGHARIAVQESEAGAWSSTHVTMIAGSIESLPASSCVMTPLALPLEEATANDEGARDEVVDERMARERPEPVGPLEAPAPEVTIDPAALLAERVDRLAQAQGLVSRDPDAALAALRALSAEWPDAPVEEEIETSIVEALIAGGHGDRSREAAERLVRRWGARHQGLLDEAQALP